MERHKKRTSVAVVCGVVVLVVSVVNVVTGPVRVLTIVFVLVPVTVVRINLFVMGRRVRVMEMIRRGAQQYRLLFGPFM